MSKFSGSLIGPAEASSKKNAFINISLILKVFFLSSQSRLKVHYFVLPIYTIRAPSPGG